VFRFAEEHHAARFIKEFGGESMHPSERGKGGGGLRGARARTSRSRETRMPLRLSLFLEHFRLQTRQGAAMALSAKWTSQPCLSAQAMLS
jgi:hypothetical protein